MKNKKTSKIVWCEKCKIGFINYKNEFTCPHCLSINNKYLQPTKKK
jgi:Zn finger protein HypA/HybF involved in hydrogenase expression